MDKAQSNTTLNVSLRKSAAPLTVDVGPVKQIEGSQRFFLGDPDSPFLAPRGVFCHGSKLLVSDTGQNRVFIWNSIPESFHQKPDIIIGQADNSNTGRNSGGVSSAQSLQYPSAVWTDGIRLIVADAWNHRVLIWNTFPEVSHQGADVVLGQDDFAGNQPNKIGVNSDCSASSLYWPYGLAVHDNKLFVADTGNRRVLVFNTIPQISGMQADYVIGQSDFTERGYNPVNAIWPYAVTLGPEGQLAITDTQYYRVLIWEHWEKALESMADCIIGQKDFEANGQNQFSLTAHAKGLSWCYFTSFYQKGMFVADTGNSRVLWYENVPRENGPEATSLIGKPDFNTSSEFAATGFGTEQSLYWPFSFSISRERNQMLIADTGNHRIVMCDLLV